MHSHPITIITRREVRETLSDWRIVLPIALLTFLMPLLLAGAAREVINVVEDPGLAGRLVPFAALLVGFIPASFSLITALESFVGERERNTLESILAMPVSDRALFISKFISSLATPLVSCMLAMTIFVLLLALFNPALYAAAMTPLRLLQLVTLVVLMAVVMVAAAVVISSHITTIRAANLMSSFVLLPMALVVQFAAFLIINQRWFELWLIAAALATAAVLLIRIGLSTFSREEILSREQTQGSLWRGGKRSETVSHTPFAANPVLAIVRRELVETLSDWRVLVPVLILAGVVPMALVLSAGFAVDFVGDLRQVGRLVPFAALLVGFVPASFSLITALESFVGERERNSLESLLAMPLSDGQLYVGKLYAALTVPIAASMVAILVFLGALAALHPALYAVAMGLEQIVLVLLMIAVVTVVMVAGAVVISSHTSSIRAATLLASLVLIPTAVTIQLQALPIIAARWDILWIVVSAMAVIAVALMRCGLKTFNREEIVSREHEQLSLPRLRQQFETFFCEYRPAGVVPEAYQGLPFSPMRFYRQEFPALLRELRLPLLVALVAVASGYLMGIYISTNYRLGVVENAFNAVGTAPPPSFGFAMGVFANNLRVSILSNLASLFSFGVFAFLVPAVAFAQIGFVAHRLQLQGGSWLELANNSPLQFLLAYVVPHGMVELPAFLLSAALGLRMGAALLAPPRGFTVGQNMLWAIANFAKVWLLVLLPAILVGSLIEGFITPVIVRMLYG